MPIAGADQAFLQGLMASKIIAQSEAMDYYNQCEVNIAHAMDRQPKKIRDRHAFGQRIDDITRMITSHGFSLRGIYSPFERKNFYVLINTIDDDSGSAANVFSKSETAMITELIDVLIENDGQIAKNEAHDIGRDHKMTTTEASFFVSKLDNLHWFRTIQTDPNDDVYVTFGPRAIAEIPRVKNFARNLSINGDGGHRQIQNGANARVVDHGDDDEGDSEDDVVVSRSSRRRSVPRMSQEHELMNIDNTADDEVRDEDEDDEIQPSRPQRPSQSSSQSLRRTRSRSSRSTRRSSQYDYE